MEATLPTWGKRPDLCSDLCCASKALAHQKRWVRRALGQNPCRSFHQTLVGAKDARPGQEHDSEVCFPDRQGSSGLQRADGLGKQRRESGGPVRGEGGRSVVEGGRGLQRKRKVRHAGSTGGESAAGVQDPNPLFAKD